MSAGSYSLINLEQVEDAAAQSGRSGHQARLATRDLEAERTGVSHHRLEPGVRQWLGHRHQEAEEVYVVIGGSGRVKLDDEILELNLLDAVRVTPPVMRCFEAGPEGMQLIACGPRHDGDGEAVPGWWSD